MEAGPWRRRLAKLSLFGAVLYLIYPSLGIFELIPDPIPFVGNLDEGVAGALIFWALKILREDRGSRTPPMKTVSEEPGVLPPGKNQN